jgi:hypothetical protein
MNSYKKLKAMRFPFEVRCVDATNTDGKLEHGKIYTVSCSYIPDFKEWSCQFEIDGLYWEADRFIQVLKIHKEIHMKEFKCPNCGAKCTPDVFDDMNLDGVTTQMFCVLCTECLSVSRTFACGENVSANLVASTMAQDIKGFRKLHNMLDTYKGN